ncbi:histidinol dehydrogenase [Xanthobacter agilis]|uniref:Histidinol dehydrogenase n=1 Tax=Xanthobacter agilis TaxID=47492 RepID=A0ABU0LGT6_XANAG|nr:histidinol dehydrogenase [Xanthobacter agilis]MDQ0506356.1 histidinol dehydrogenase [Xanthobacter agilis]
MPIRLDTEHSDFPARFATFLGSKRETSVDVQDQVSAIIADVRARGDEALIDLSRTFDRVDLAALGIKVTDAELDAALASIPAETRAALEFAKARIEAHHARQRPTDETYTDAAGVTLGHRWTSVDAVGLYVPGGTAAYPSSVLMNAVPAQVAGVPRIVMVVPAPDGQIAPLVLAAARLAGVNEVYRVGGAQAVAALAYGTATIPAVDKIVGPGNAYVAQAKRQVFGQVGIDMVAGPSEVLILADATANADWIAADLLAQAEHDTAAQSILVTDSDDLAARVVAAVDSMLDTLPRAEIARASWRDHGAVIKVRDLDEAPALVDRVAPEHLEIQAQNADRLAARIRHAGAIFIGAYTPEAIGDYVGGTNHVLPTARSARFSSGLSVLDFMKRTSILKLDADALGKVGTAAVRLAEVERLQAHGRSVSIRTNAGGGQ